MTAPIRVVVATRNPGKLAELAQLLAGAEIELISLRDFPDAPVVAEEFATYKENALAKARAITRHTGLPAVADDSGLEVDALGGEPGVRSARFAGEASDDARNIEKLLHLMKDVPAAQRTARFRCVMAVAVPVSESTLVVEGVVEGCIARTPHGAGGFGYDPLFIVPSLGRTFAELPPADKHRLSHRGHACERLRERLPAFLRASGRS